MSRTRRLLCLESLEAREVPAVVGQLRVVDYNILNLPNTSAMTTVLQEIGNQTVGGLARPIDVLLLQEINNQAGQTQSVLNILNGLYGANTYARGIQDHPQSGGDRQGIIYRVSTVNLLDEDFVSGTTGPRAPSRYQLSADADPTRTFYIYNSHYDAVDQPDRLSEAEGIRANADALGAGTEILYVGDYNIDSSNEGMYTTLLSSGNGQAFDPINRPSGVGTNWSNNASFKDIHTQATRVAVLPDGGASGGMDDRFDFMLHTQEVGGSGITSNGVGLEYRAGSYRVYGNNNTHTFNGDINSGSGFPAGVLDALRLSSDHLPVVADYDIVTPGETTPPTVTSIDDGDADNLVPANVALTYTVTFSEDILNGSFTAADLNNAGTATLSFGTITETSAGVFTVAVTPTTGGTIVLRIPTGALVEDVAGNDLVVPVQDDTTVTVDATAPTIGAANFVDNVAGGPVAVNATVTYTLTFSEDILNGSFTAADLNNAGTATLSFGTITETSAGVFTVAVTPTTTGTLILRIPTGSVVEDVVGNDLTVPVQDNTAITVNPAPTVLQVAALAPTHSGFVVDFNRALDPADLNLYDSGAGLLGAADATLTGPGGAVRGSLVVDPGLTRVTFVATGGVLAAGSHTVTLRSAANGFKDASAGLLDGDANGAAGGDYATSFTVSSTARVVSVPDFARGAGQPANVPATATGIPLRVSDAAGVTSVQADLLFDPALLTVPTGTFAAAFGGTLTVTTIAGGVRLTVTGLSGATGTNATVASVGASVPNAAPYASKQVLNLQNASINGGAIAARDDDAVHLAAYFGDATGNGGLSGQDASLVSQVAAAIATGFAAYQLADPVLVGDITGNGGLSGQDASFVSVRATGQSVPQIPDIPGIPAPPAGGPDPRLYLVGGSARPGETVTIQLRMEVTERAGIALSSGDYAIRFDATRFQVANVRAGSMLAGFAVAANVDNGAGTIRVAQFSATERAFAFGADGDVLLFDLIVRADARRGRSSLNLMESLSGNGSTTRTGLENAAGSLTLIPAPTDSAFDPGDGVFTVLGRRAALDSGRGVVAAVRRHAVSRGAAMPPLDVSRTGTPDRLAGFAPPGDDDGGPGRVGRMRLRA